MFRYVAALWRHMWYGPRLMTRRGHYLFMFGLIYILLGAGVLLQRPTDEVVTAAINRIVPPPIYGIGSIAGGIFCIVVAWRRTKGWQQTFAFSLLALLVCYRSLAHGYAFLEFGITAQLVPFFIWIALARIHILVAGWVEPPTHTVGPVPFSEAIITVMAEEMIRKERELEKYKNGEGER